MTRQLLLGSNNAKKRAELAGILEGLDFNVRTPAEMGDFPEPVEDGTTFKENGTIKALYYSRLTGLLTLADDSGLEVDALGGRPGIHSARYAGEKASDRDNCLKLLKELENVPDSRRTARFVCAIVVVNGDKIIGTAQGSCEGRILHDLTGSGGFGYDPLFYYPPEDRTFAELPAEIKNGISHRAHALKDIRAVLEKI